MDTTGEECIRTNFENEKAQIINRIFIKYRIEFYERHSSVAGGLS